VSRCVIGYVVCDVI